MGHWALGIGHWSLVIGHWSLVIGHWAWGMVIPLVPLSLTLREAKATSPPVFSSIFNFEF
ncbi:hypothetical protein [Nostoc sp.]